MKRYFISDVHAGPGWRTRRRVRSKSIADDLTPDKERVLLRLIERIADERAKLIIVGDLLEAYGCRTSELICGNLYLLRRIQEVVEFTAWGNHEPSDLPDDWITALKLTEQRLFDFDGYLVAVEHGHYGDPSWQRDWWVKAAARGLYWTEGHLWGGADEWLAARWHDIQDRARRKANTSNALPYWWRAEELARAFPQVRAVVLGHSHRQGMSVLPSGTSYVNTGTWARNDRGEERMDVTSLEAGTWWQGQAGELV